jgi:hypothetical protein
LICLPEPAVGIEPTTARLRIECSTTELRWHSEDALARTRTVTPCGTTPSRWRVYQFHHQGNAGRAEQLRDRRIQLKAPALTHPLLHLHAPTGPTGLEPATSRVTVECSNQTELRPLNGLPALRRTSFPATGAVHATRFCLRRTCTCACTCACNCSCDEWLDSP